MNRLRPRFLRDILGFMFSRAVRPFAWVFALGVHLACEPSRVPEVPDPPTVLRLRLRLPLGAEPARTCDSDCASRHVLGTSKFLECFAGCPGAEVSDEAVCSTNDVRPDSACYMVDVIDEPASGGEPSSSPGALGTILGGLLDHASRASTAGPKSSPRPSPRIVPAGASPAGGTAAQPEQRSPANPSIVPAGTMRATVVRTRDGGA